MRQVEAHQRSAESSLLEYTFTEKVTNYELNKDGTVRRQDSDTFYVTPTSYELFTLHVSHDGKRVPQAEIESQLKKMARRMKEDQNKARKGEEIHPQGQMSLATIMTRSNFTAIRWEHVRGLKTIVYSFKPKVTTRPQGDVVEKILDDLQGTMWVDPEEEEVVRIEFSSVAALSFGLWGKVSGFHGVTERQRVNGGVWGPTRQEYFANGRALFSGVRIHQVSEYGEYLKATTDVVQQARSVLPATR